MFVHGMDTAFQNLLFRSHPPHPDRHDIWPFPTRHPHPSVIMTFKTACFNSFWGGSVANVIEHCATMSVGPVCWWVLGYAMHLLQVICWVLFVFFAGSTATPTPLPLHALQFMISVYNNERHWKFAVSFFSFSAKTEMNAYKHHISAPSVDVCVVYMS